MKFRQLAILIVVTIGLIFIATAYWDKRAPAKTTSKTLLFPALNARINDVKIVEIKGFEEQVILSHNDNIWVIQSSDNFPAISEKIKRLILNLSELTIDSEKTKNPELYSRLGVEGPYERTTNSKLVSLLDENGDVIESLIIGKERESNQSTPALYVRQPEQENALLVQGRIEVSSLEKDWFQQSIIDLDSAEVKSITITQPGQAPYGLMRAAEGQVNFSLSSIPEGKKPQSEVILNRIGRILEDVRAESVLSTESIDLSENTVHTSLESFRGLKVNIRLKQNSDKHYANFEFAYQAPEGQDSNPQNTETSENTAPENLTPEQEIALLNAQMSPWVFEIPKFKYDDMTIALEKLIRD